MRKITLTLVCLILASLLQGCIAAGAVVGVGTAGASVITDRRSFHTMDVDLSIEHKARQQINANCVLARSTHIVIQAYNGVVLLAGETPTEDMRNQVEQIVKSNPDVRRVFNMITIQNPISLYQISKDATIATNVKTRFITTTNISANHFTIVVENKVVYLMGLNSHSQTDAAAEVASNSTGVKKVVKLVEYINC